MAKASKPEVKGDKVKPKDDVTIEWTDKDKFHKAGTTSTVHRVQAEKLIAAGKAKKATAKAEK